jgi:hypothetical protein
MTPELSMPPEGTILILEHPSRLPEAVMVDSHSGSSIVLLRAPLVPGDRLDRWVKNYADLCATHKVRLAGPTDDAAFTALKNCIRKHMQTLQTQAAQSMRVARQVHRVQFPSPGA